MKYPKFRHWVDAMCCALAGLLDNLVVLVTLGVFRPNWEMTCIRYFRIKDLKIRIKEQEDELLKN